MIAASSRAEFSLKRLSFFPEPALTFCHHPYQLLGFQYFRFCSFLISGDRNYGQLFDDWEAGHNPAVDQYLA